MTEYEEMSLDLLRKISNKLDEIVENTKSIKGINQKVDEIKSTVGVNLREINENVRRISNK